MPDASDLSSPMPTSRERARRALYRIADSLRCRPELILDAVRSDAFPDPTAEMARLWFKMKSPEDRAILLEQERALARKPG